MVGHRGGAMAGAVPAVYRRVKKRRQIRLQMEMCHQVDEGGKERGREGEAGEGKHEAP